MPAPHQAPKKQVAVSDARAGVPQMLEEQRALIADRIADAPAAWISIPMWGRVFTLTRRILGISHRGWKES